MDLIKLALKNPAAVVAATVLTLAFGILALFELPGLEQIEGNAGPGNSWVNLRFAVGTDLRDVLVDVLGRLNRLPSLPDDADPPRVQMNSARSGCTPATASCCRCRSWPGSTPAWSRPSCAASMAVAPSPWPSIRQPTSRWTMR